MAELRPSSGCCTPAGLVPGALLAQLGALARLGVCRQAGQPSHRLAILWLRDSGTGCFTAAGSTAPQPSVTRMFVRIRFISPRVQAVSRPLSHCAGSLDGLALLGLEWSGPVVCKASLAPGAAGAATGLSPPKLRPCQWGEWGCPAPGSCCCSLLLFPHVCVSLGCCQISYRLHLQEEELLFFFPTFFFEVVFRG